GARERALFFEALWWPQHGIGIPARVAAEDGMYDKKIKPGECISALGGVGVHDAHFLADEIHGLEPAAMNGFHHLVVVESLAGRQLHLPATLKSRAHFGIIHRLVTRKHIWHRPVITGSLYIVVPAERISTRARPHVIAADEQQVRNGCRGIGTLGVLSYSHCPEYAHGLR